MPFALIQLISEQTMQNLVPLLALKPAKVFHLATPKTAPRSANIVEAARQAQVIAELENIQLTEMPSIPETSRAVIRSIADARAYGLTPVVNFTGGTKLMSIGAYEAAMREQVTSLYVDTDHQQFLDGHTGPKLNSVLGDDFSFTALQKALTVNAIAVANGRQRVTGGRDWKPFLPLARHFLDSPHDETASWDSIQGNDGLSPKGVEPRSAADWLPLLNKPLRLPEKVGQMAVDSGLIRAAGGSFLLPDATQGRLEELSGAERVFPPDYYAAIRPIQFSLSFFSGGWWEVIVAEAAERCGLFRDIRWSAHAGRRGGSDPEEDILAVDGVQVVCISCKRGGARAKLLSHLEQLNTRARSLGGNFTRRFLAVYVPIRGPSGAALRQRASELDVRILSPVDLRRSTAFSRSRTAV